MKYYWVLTRYASYCLTVNANNIIEDVPPYGRWLLGKNFDEVYRFYSTATGLTIERVL